MIRSILILVFFVIFLIFSLPCLLVFALIRVFHPKAAGIASLRLAQFSFRVVLFLSGAKVTVLGLENVPKDQAVLYVPNHRSYFDIMLVYRYCSGITGFVAKDGMSKIPGVNLWMKMLYCLPIDRANIREGLKVILKGIDYMKEGISMCVFPEGTRNKVTVEMLPFREGSMKLAEKSDCPIIPVAITNSAGLLENHSPRVKPAHVILHYGDPIDTHDLSRAEKKFLGHYTQEIIENMLWEDEKLLEELENK